MAEPDDYRRYGDGLGETENFWIRDYENVLIFVFVFIIPVTLANLGFSHFYPESSYSIQSQLNDFHSLKRPKSALKVRLLVDLDFQKLKNSSPLMVSEHCQLCLLLFITVAILLVL